MNKFLHDPSRYSHYRPLYPKKIFEYLSSISYEKNLAIDCGAGSGQATQGLSWYFKKVIAIDLSKELLLKAPPLPNTIYIQASCEKMPVDSNSVDLICVSQAVHWFPLNEFYDEVKRILKQNGIIAVWGYNQATIEPSIDSVIHKIYQKISSLQNISIERQYLYEQYQNMPFPFNRLKTPIFQIEMNWNLIQLLGYISTWPGLLEYEKKFGINLLNEFNEEFYSNWKDPYLSKPIIWPIFILLGHADS